MKTPIPRHYISKDGSVLSEDGTILFFSMTRFRRDIWEGECCFICGVHPDSAAFNDEHVIPDWVLRDLKMHHKTIVLANGSVCRYDRYKLSCCVSCNSLLGERIETPVSNIIKGGMNSVVAHIKEHGPWVLFLWLALLFLKTHLSDKTFRWHLDSRKGDFPIADTYHCADLHHIHCLTRAFITKATLASKALGTFIALPAWEAEFVEPFSYGDLYQYQAVHFRFRDVALIAVLNDSCGCSSLENDHLFKKIKGALSPLQISELTARLAYLNSLIKVRPGGISVPSFRGRETSFLLVPSIAEMVSALFP